MSTPSAPQLNAIDSGLGIAGRARWMRITAWVGRYPLVVCLPVQALLLFADLGRMPLWGDEQPSLARAALSLGGLSAGPSDTVHPALYFLLLHGWFAAFCGGPCLIGARALSAFFVLAATLAIDRCWLGALDRRTRTCFLILWTLSPALLLYGRMARSYSLQLLLACLALYAGSRYARRATLASLLAYVAAAAALLSTHYLPGIAVVAGVAAAMTWPAVIHRRPAALGPVVVSLVAIGFAFAPWVPKLTGAVERVALNQGYHVVGRVADVVVALAFTFVSFSVGETLWPWMVAALVLLAPVLAVILWRGVRAAPPWLAFVAPAAVVGFIGAYQWVSYAFVAPRVLFLLPFYLLLLVQGARVQTGVGTAVCAGVALLSLGGIAAYFDQAGFLNKAYLVPTETIAAAIRAGSPAGPLTVILDEYSIDLGAVAAQLPDGARTLFIVDSASAAAAVGLSTEPGLQRVWFVHSAHDVSPQHWNELVERAFATRFALRRTEFVPYSALDRWLMGLAGWSTRPSYAVEVAEMQLADGGQ